MLRKQRELKYEARFDRYCNLEIFDAPDPPDPNPGIIANAQASERVGLEAVDLGRQQFAYSKERNAQLDALAKRVIDQQMAIADRTSSTADEFADYYRRTFRPLEEQIVQAARDFNVEGTLVNQAAADTRQAFAAMRGQQDRAQRRYGIAPNAALMQDANIAEAAALAGNVNRARMQGTVQKQAMMLDAAALGRDKPMNSTANFATSLNAGNSAIANQNSTNAATAMNTDAARGWYGTGVSAMGNAGSLYGMDYQGRVSAYNAQAGGYGAGMAGLGQLAGQAFLGGSRPWVFAADGGEVDGPGGPRDDAIPARLSDGEYVIPADVVKAKGTEFFDKLLERYHKDRAQAKAPPPEKEVYQPRQAAMYAADGGVVERRHMTRAIPLREMNQMMGRR